MQESCNTKIFWFLRNDYESSKYKNIFLTISLPIPDICRSWGKNRVGSVVSFLPSFVSVLYSGGPCLWTRGRPSHIPKLSPHQRQVDDLGYPWGEECVYQWLDLSSGVLSLPGPHPDLLNKSILFLKISRWFVCKLEFENFHFQGGGWTQRPPVS